MLSAARDIAWQRQPTHSISAIFTFGNFSQDDGLSLGDMGTMLDCFPNQSLDFYSAMRGSLFDNQIRRWIETDIVGDSIINEDANLGELSRRLVDK